MNRITEAVRQIIESEKPEGSTTEAYRSVYSMIDLTSLEGSDNRDRIDQLCQEAQTSSIPGYPDLKVASVCVYPVFARQVSDQLSGSGILTACVAGGFPSGQMPMELRLKELQYALDGGADEIDMVISRGRMIAGDEDFVRREIAAFAERCNGRAHLKVILETGELKDEYLIRRASRIALESGADFLKTSTGKIQPGATPEAFYLMLEELKLYHDETGEKRGIKAAGGISDPEAALEYYLLTKSVLGIEWLNSKLLRYGASRLAGKLRDIFRIP